MTRSCPRLALLIVLALPIPATLHAQGGFLKRVKQKAAEKIAEKAVDKATERGKDSSTARASDSAQAAKDSRQAPAAQDPASGGSGRGMSIRREKPLDPTKLETPGYPGGRGSGQATARGGAAASAQGGAQAGAQPSWHGTTMSLDAFKSSIPEVTEERLVRYIRAREAVTDEAMRLGKMGPREIHEYMGTVLAQDEKPPLPGYMLLFPMAGPRRIERHLDDVVERALGGSMTRMQFYQMHEMVEMFLNKDVNRPGMQAGVMGRKLSAAELAVLEKHRAALAMLREKGRNAL